MPAQLRVPDDLKSYLAERDLAVWQCFHPMIPTEKGHSKGDKTRVEVQLAGPQLMDYSPWGFGPTVRAAIDDALAHPFIRALDTGLGGAMARLEEEMRCLTIALIMDRLDDDIPF
jgi:hypothetical protein